MAFIKLKIREIDDIIRPGDKVIVEQYDGDIHKVTVSTVLCCSLDNISDDDHIYFWEQEVCLWAYRKQCKKLYVTNSTKI